MATSDQTVGPTLRANRWPFIWLAINVLLVGATLGVERTVVPLLGHHVYHIGPAAGPTAWGAGPSCAWGGRPAFPWSSC